MDEAEITLSVNGTPWLSFLCTPHDLEALAVGFLFNEGVIDCRDEIGLVSVCGGGDLVDVWLTHAAELPARWRRTSGCGGGVTAGPAPSVPAPGGGTVLRPADVTTLMADMLASQELHRAAGGVHTSALADGGRLVLCVEDIGRHNTFDKVAGRCLLDGRHAAEPVLVTTGRVSSEMVEKAARLGAAVVISCTSPTSLSVALADRLGITLVGYAVADRFDVYTHDERIA